MHLGQAGDHLEDPPLFADGDRRRAQHVLAVGDVAVHARLGADDHAVADLGLVLDARLAGHDDVVAGLAAPAMPTWPQSRLWRPIWLLWPIITRLSILVPSPIRVVSNVARSIVQLAPISTSLLDLEPAGMRDLHVPSVDLAVAESVAAQHAPGVDLDPVAQDDVRIEHGVGMDDAVAAQLAAVADDGAGMEGRSVADRRRPSPT